MLCCRAVPFFALVTKPFMIPTGASMSQNVKLVRVGWLLISLRGTPSGYTRPTPALHSAALAPAHPDALIRPYAGAGQKDGTHYESHRQTTRYKRHTALGNRGRGGQKSRVPSQISTRMRPAKHSRKALYLSLLRERDEMTGTPVQHSSIPHAEVYHGTTERPENL